MNPNHEKKKTRPYLLTGFNTGMVRAFELIGLTTGAETMALKKPILENVLLFCRKYSEVWLIEVGSW